MVDTSINQVAKWKDSRLSNEFNKVHIAVMTSFEKFGVPQPNVEYKKCLDERLETLKYSCLNFDNWVIAFKIENENFNIYEIILGPILK